VVGLLFYLLFIIYYLKQLFRYSTLLKGVDYPVHHSPIRYESLVQCVHDSIKECAKDKQKDLFNFILLCGEVPPVPEFYEELKIDFAENTKENFNFICPKDPELAVLRGASSFSRASKFIEMSTTRAEYCMSSHADTNPIAAPTGFC